MHQVCGLATLFSARIELHAIALARGEAVGILAERSLGQAWEIDRLKSPGYFLRILSFTQRSDDTFSAHLLQAARTRAPRLRRRTAPLGFEPPANRGFAWHGGHARLGRLGRFEYQID